MMRMIVLAVVVGACGKGQRGAARGSCELTYAEGSPDGSIAKGLQSCSAGWIASRCNANGTGAGVTGLHTTDYVFTAGATCEQRGYQDCGHGRGTYYKVCPDAGPGSSGSAVAAAGGAAGGSGDGGGGAAPLPAVDCSGAECVKEALALGDAEPEKAVALFSKACSDGQAVACAMVGTAFETGHGVAADGKRALEYDEKSCTLGYAKGCYNFGLALANGVGGSPDLPRALPILEKACADGAWKACGSVGSYRLGTGDQAGAAKVLVVGCKHNDTLSCQELAQVPEAMRGPAIDADDHPSRPPVKAAAHAAKSKPQTDVADPYGM